MIPSSMLILHMINTKIMVVLSQLPGVHEKCLVLAYIFKATREM